MIDSAPLYYPQKGSFGDNIMGQNQSFDVKFGPVRQVEYY